ncbi:MAG: aldehyde dehydrogenase family protein, partial [Gammaproteobacteria bacterium]|nr:aldehyde dehydrogenase family protein [Gammaproteobacteria bacterium]
MDIEVKQTLSHYINGKHAAGGGQRFGDVYNPALGRVTKRVPLASKEEVRAAVTAAAEAFPGWAATPAGKRAQVLFAFRDLI